MAFPPDLNDYCPFDLGTIKNVTICTEIPRFNKFRLIRYLLGNESDGQESYVSSLPRYDATIADLRREFQCEAQRYLDSCLTDQISRDCDVNEFRTFLNAIPRMNELRTMLRSKYSKDICAATLNLLLTDLCKNGMQLNAAEYFTPYEALGALTAPVVANLPKTVLDSGFAEIKQSPEVTITAPTNSVRLRDFLAFLEDRLRIENWTSTHPTPVSMTASEAHTWMCANALNCYTTSSISSETEASSYSAYLTIADECHRIYQADLNPMRFRLTLSKITKQMKCELADVLGWTADEFQSQFEKLLNASTASTLTDFAAGAAKQTEEITKSEWATQQLQKNTEAVDALVSKFFVERPRGLETDLADVYYFVARGIRECSRLIASVPHLWHDENEYRRLAKCVSDAATDASNAYLVVDIRLRRAGGPNPILDCLNDVLTVQSRAPLDLKTTSCSLKAILTNLESKKAELFQRVEGKGCLDRMLDQLAHVPIESKSYTATGSPSAESDDTKCDQEQFAALPNPIPRALNRSGRTPLSESKKPEDIAQHNVYQLIREAKVKNRGFGKKSLKSHFKADKDFKELVERAGLKFDDQMFHTALVWIDENDPISQETQSGNVS